MRVHHLARRLALPVAALLTLAACSSGSSDPQASDGTSGTSGADGVVKIVASTNVYGDIAATIGGDAVDVTSVISDPSADPHSYEANAQTQLALSKADIVIENGGGYDDFVDTMLDATSNTDVTVLNAVDLSGKQAADGAELNEHVWYDFPTVSTLVDSLTAALSKAAPAKAETFRSNATTFKDGLATLEASEKTIAAAHAGAGVAITEPVPLYLLEAAGLKNVTPPEFSEAIEEETDVSPTTLQATLDLFTSHTASLLVYNAQTTGPETEKVRAAATESSVPVVPVTETLPAGQTYLSWMTANVAAVADALSH